MRGKEPQKLDSAAQGGHFLGKLAPASYRGWRLLHCSQAAGKEQPGFVRGFRLATRRKATNRQNSSPGDVSARSLCPQPDVGPTPPPKATPRPPLGVQTRPAVRTRAVPSLILHLQTPQSRPGPTFGRVVHGHGEEAPRDSTHSVVEAAALIFALGGRDSRGATVRPLVRIHDARL